ncbi:MAG: thiamine phosphate synthase [Mucilaginibacter sp.]
MKKYISKFHYLTQDLPHRSHIEQAQIACSNGANWVQYRCLTKPDEELIAEINTIAEICDDWGATLILTDHYHLLNKVDAQGVHIEDLEADLEAIRNQIGEDKTLGTSAIDIDRLLQLQQAGVVDYSAYGPFARTDTKPNDFTLLGFEGYRQLTAYAFELPIIAVGGIKLEDVTPLMETDVFGIAISAPINLAVDPANAVKEFYRKIY